MKNKYILSLPLLMLLFSCGGATSVSESVNSASYEETTPISESLTSSSDEAESTSEKVEEDNFTALLSNIEANHNYTMHNDGNNLTMEFYSPYSYYFDYSDYDNSIGCPDFGYYLSNTGIYYVVEEDAALKIESFVGYDESRETFDEYFDYSFSTLIENVDKLEQSEENTYVSTDETIINTVGSIAGDSSDSWELFEEVEFNFTSKTSMTINVYGQIEQYDDDGNEYFIDILYETISIYDVGSTSRDNSDDFLTKHDIADMTGYTSTFNRLVYQTFGEYLPFVNGLKFGYYYDDEGNSDLQVNLTDPRQFEYYDENSGDLSSDFNSALLDAGWEYSETMSQNPSKNATNGYSLSIYTKKYSDKDSSTYTPSMNKFIRVTYVYPGTDSNFPDGVFHLMGGLLIDNYDFSDVSEFNGYIDDVLEGNLPKLSTAYDYSFSGYDYKKTANFNYDYDFYLSCLELNLEFSDNESLTDFLIDYETELFGMGYYVASSSIEEEYLGKWEFYEEIDDYNINVTKTVEFLTDNIAVIDDETYDYSVSENDDGTYSIQVADEFTYTFTPSLYGREEKLAYSDSDSSYSTDRHSRVGFACGAESVEYANYYGYLVRVYLNNSNNVDASSNKVEIQFFAIDWDNVTD